MRSSRASRIVAGVLAASFVLSACGEDEPQIGATGATTTGPATTGPTGGTATGATGDTGGEEPASGSITYTAVDYGFEGPDVIASGDVEITLENEGTEPHEFVMFPVAEGTTIEDALNFIEENPNSDEIPEFVIGEAVATFARPGKTSRRPIDTSLEPGPYMVACFVPSKENDGTPHVLLGMIRNITVV